MDIHKLLYRQLEKCNISIDKKPENDEMWQKFLARINQAYIDADQERYMQDRSIEISSREMRQLNQKLENAQHIVGLGYWSYDGKCDRAIWSNELFSMLGLNPINNPPNVQQFMELVYEQDRYELQQKLETALEKKINYECELRVRHADGTYRWYKTIGHCLEEEKQLEGIFIDIHKNKIAEEKIKDLNQQISSTARRAGMAEVATTILHNIGNILNSSNTSINLLKNNLNQNYMKKLFKIIEMLSQHKEDLSDFLTNDSKGRLIPEYLVVLSKRILEDSQNNMIEVDNLINDLKHINEIVAMQKPLSGTSSINEQIYIPEIIETVLSMTISKSESEFIEVIKELDQCPLIVNDKSKLLQILVNLVQNAKEAVLLNTTNSIKKIKIVINKNHDNSLQIKIIDNGIGIKHNNLNRIFSFGFTTKLTGHGFGLHSSALSAEAMGGALFAESAGEGCGAQFILTLPI
ncbi:ATP-binding protein [Legionella maioricensis]|uniref:histidine kinase n=1 Tax=Legionella maioricensis TaxID=2896528 RepID=A0A9X2D0I8_9GAMM|nr:PAS domain-containing sensor histidine kinase [Legionella maioricensis]MCL9683622.1 PAS domain-containing sensor histidine kinase [Legionella maioricensis]MCL9687644.1 PAS domain-containing sensor histidine kinase [Legionella maioricensis]